MAEEYYLVPPRQQMFYRIFVLTLNIIGLGKRTWWGYKPINGLLRLHGTFVVTVAPFCAITQFAYLYSNYVNLPFYIIRTICLIIPVTVLVNINIISTKMGSYKILMENFMTKIHIRNYCTHHSDYMRQTMLLIERVTRFTACYLIFFFGLNWLCWINIPMVHNFANTKKILNGTMQLQTCVYIWMPFDYAYNYSNWTIVHLINVYIVGIGVTIMATLHCLNYIIIYHLIGHVLVLKNTIRSKFNYSLKLNDEEVKNGLIGIIHHHSFILRVFNEMQSAFGINVAANYLHNLFSDSLILYQVLNGVWILVIIVDIVNTFGDIFSYAVMVGAYMGELIFMSFVIEEIRKQSEDLPEVVFSIPWENMSISNQKIFILILSRVQTEMQFVALGGLKAGVHPMVSTLKTTFSYYVILKSTIESNEN